MDPKQLLEQRTKLMGEMEALIKTSETREWTPEEQKAFDELKAKVDDMDMRLREMQQPPQDPEKAPEQNAKAGPSEGWATRAQEARKAFESRQTPHQVGFVRDLNDRQANYQKGLALRGWLKGGEADDNELSAMHASGVRGNKLILPSKGEIESRAPQTVTTTGGGHTVQTSVANRLSERLAYYCKVLQYCDVLNTTDLAPLKSPTVDDVATLANAGTINTASSEDALVFGQADLNVYKRTTEILVPIELLRSTAITDLESRMVDLLAKRIGRKLSSDATVGAGSTAPQGMVVGATTGKTTASATAIAGDEILDLMAELDPDYREGAVLFMHSKIWNAVRKLKDSQGRYLAGDFNTLAAGQTPMIDGVPVVFNNYMDNAVTTGKKTILYCNPKEFTIRLAGPMELIRDESRFVREDQILIKVRQFWGSVVMQPTAFQLLVQA
jgi:HK97 family phage major capsid protein